MKLYNIQKRKKEDISIKTNKPFKMYVCGPTVYDFAHIGNLRTYINVDLLRRWLNFSHFQVFEVMNITDIEDKIIKKSLEEGVSYKNVTQKYEKEFLYNLDKLNVELPDMMPHATDGVVIDQIIEIISALIDKEIAYKSDDGSIYFSVDRFKEYGKLSGVDLAGTKAGARVSLDEYEKDNARDFVLWKAKQPEEPSWPAPFGEGRPGWHIECSAMAIKYLGNTIDLHAGGVDLVFPHHENEIAQSEAYTGEKFVKHWFHAEHLMVEGQKMSKSLNNIYTLDEMADIYRVEPIAFRMLVLSSHYRERLNFTNDSIIQAQNTLNNLRNFVLNNKESKAKVTDQDLEVLEKEFSDALNDDLNMPKAFAAIFDFIGKVNKEKTYSEEIYRYFLKIDQVLGLSLDQIMPDDDIKKLFESYKIARMAKDYKESDKLRKLITEKGWTTEDSDGESKLRKA